MKCITLLLDGASDRSYDELGGLTPLQYASTPNLDKLAGKSQCGLMTVYQEGIALGTDLAHMILFGYDVTEYPQRSIIDIIGESVPVDKDAVYLRCSFADVTKSNGFLINSRFTSELSDGDIATLSSLLTYESDGVRFEFIHSYDSHGFIKITGAGITDKVSDSDPFNLPNYVMRVEPFETSDRDATHTADLINAYIKYTYDVLADHNINVKRKTQGMAVGNLLLTKWAGKYRPVENFKIRNGMKGLLVGQSNLLQGVAAYINMDYKRYDTLQEGITTAIDCSYEYVHLHTKDPDTASHKKDPHMKVKTLESIDNALSPLIDFDGLLIVTSDHSTPCSGKAIHSGESVAFMSKGQFIRRDEVKVFNEVECSKGSIHLKGRDFMNYVINATDRGSMFHLRQGNKKRHYILSDVSKLL